MIALFLLPTDGLFNNLILRINHLRFLILERLLLKIIVVVNNSNTSMIKTYVYRCIFVDGAVFNRNP